MIGKSLAVTEAKLEMLGVGLSAEQSAECVADKGYHSRAVLKTLDGGTWKTRIAEAEELFALARRRCSTPGGGQ